MNVLCQGLKGRIEGWLNGDAPASGRDHVNDEDDRDDEEDDGDDD